MTRESASSPRKGHSGTTSRIRIGCSGWQYKAWRETFYPRDLPSARWFSYYARTFDTVEINNTFYRLPEAATFARWGAAMPQGFIAAVKASRFLTHLKRLRDPDAPLALLFSRARYLGAHLGPVLYQLPRSMRYDPNRLAVFLDALPRAIGTAETGWPGDRTPREMLTLRHVIEFRDPSWYRDDVFTALETAGVSLCLHDKLGSRFDAHPVGPIAYVRFHGTSGHYAGSYPDEALEVWAARLCGWERDRHDVYAYFNNDPDASAVRNAQVLERMVFGA